MGNLLKNDSRASLLLPELNKVARNVPRKGGKVACFTGHTAFQDELKSRVEAMRDAFKSSGVGMSGDWDRADMSGMAMKTASLGDDMLHLMLRAGAEEAMEKCASVGDAATFELCAEAAVALDAAAELDRYVASRGTEKIAQLGEVGTPLAGAALGAVLGGGAKWMLSDKSERKRGLSRLLDAALVGAAAGGLGGWALNKMSPEESTMLSPEDESAATAFLKGVKGPEREAIDEAVVAAKAQARRSDDASSSASYKHLAGKSVHNPMFHAMSNDFTSAENIHSDVEDAVTSLAKQMKGFEIGASAARAAGDEKAAKAMEMRHKETRDVFKALQRNMAGGGRYDRYEKGALGMAGTAAAIAGGGPVGGVLARSAKQLFNSDKSQGELPEGVSRPTEILKALQAATAVTQRNSRVLGQLPADESMLTRGVRAWWDVADPRSIIGLQ